MIKPMAIDPGTDSESKGWKMGTTQVKKRRLAQEVNRIWIKVVEELNKKEEDLDKRRQLSPDRLARALTQTAKAGRGRQPPMKRYPGPKEVWAQVRDTSSSQMTEEKRAGIARSIAHALTTASSAHSF